MPQGHLAVPRVRVFVSSTSIDLGPEREAVEKQIHRMRTAEFVGMEYFGSRSESAQRVSLEEVENADVYVGIIGGRYGSGITEQEYRKALDRGIPRFFYVKDDSKITLRDDDVAKADRLARFRAEISDSFNGHIVTPFDNPDQLAARVAADLHRWMFEKLAATLDSAAQTGDLATIRAIADATVNRDAMRSALAELKIAAGEDLLDALLARSPAIRKRLLTGIESLATDYATRIDNFLGEYLGTPKEPVPFGGRADVLSSLDTWVRDPAAAPYLLIAAEAGRGKSAALVHWSRRLLADPDIEVVFLPVSIRFRTNLAQVTFAALAARLAALHGDDVSTDMNTSAEVWRGVVSGYLEKPLPNGKQLVVIVDGIDEAADWQAGADLFPTQPAERVRLVVSARLTANMPDEQSWLEQLGWSASVARSRTLAPLTPEGVRDVIVRMGFPLADLGSKVDVVAQLHRLSGGDPLVVRLYVADLWKKGADATRLTPEDLEKMKPGLDGYFDRWWKDQMTLWGKEAPLREKGVSAILNLLACAFAPLTGDDLVHLAPEDAGVGSFTLETYVKPLERFVIENENGYVLNHPRFAQYLFHEKMLKTDREAWNRRFVEWGKSVIGKLGRREISATEVPSYLVQYHGSHLERANAPADDLLALLTMGWRQAWETLDGGLTGFMRDIDLAWRAVIRVDDADVTAGRRPSRLGDEMFCALCKASVRSLSQNIPLPLIDRLVEEGFWRPSQALAYARNMTSVRDRVLALVVAAERAQGAEKMAILEEAFRQVTPELAEEVQVEVLFRLRSAGHAGATARLESTTWTTPAALQRLAHRYASVRDFARAATLVGSGAAFVEIRDSLVQRRDTAGVLELSASTGWPLIDDAAYWLAVEGVPEQDIRAFFDQIPYSLARVREVATQLRDRQPVSLSREDIDWLKDLAALLSADRPFATDRDLSAFVAGVARFLPDDVRDELRAGLEGPLRPEVSGLLSGGADWPEREEILKNGTASATKLAPVMDEELARKVLERSIASVDAVIQAGHVDVLLEYADRTANGDHALSIYSAVLPHLDEGRRRARAAKLMQLLDARAEDINRSVTGDVGLLASQLPRDLIPELVQFVMRVSDKGFRLFTRLALAPSDDPSQIDELLDTFHNAVERTRYLMIGILLAPEAVRGRLLLRFIEGGDVEFGRDIPIGVFLTTLREPERSVVSHKVWEELLRPGSALGDELELMFEPVPPDLLPRFAEMQIVTTNQHAAMWFARYGPCSDRGAAIDEVLQQSSPLRSEMFVQFAELLDDDQVLEVVRAYEKGEVPISTARAVAPRLQGDAFIALWQLTDGKSRFDAAAYAPAGLLKDFAVDVDDLIDYLDELPFLGIVPTPAGHIDHVLAFLRPHLTEEVIERVVHRVHAKTDLNESALGASIGLFAGLLPQLGVSPAMAWRLARIVLSRERNASRRTLLADIACLRYVLECLGVPTSAAVDAIDRASAVFP